MNTQLVNSSLAKLIGEFSPYAKKSFLNEQRVYQHEVESEYCLHYVIFESGWTGDWTNRWVLQNCTYIEDEFEDSDW